MRESYSKNYFQKYAALTLARFLHIKESDIFHDDRPDLRLYTLNLGIEVTQALTPEEAVADIKKPLYASIDMTPFDHNHKDKSFVFEKLDNAIERKIEKSRNYDVYKENGLYIFSHCHNLKEDELYRYFINLPYTYLFFRYIYINAVTRLYCFDFIDKKMSYIHFSKSELITMNVDSLRYEKTCSKERRQIILEKLFK